MLLTKFGIEKQPYNEYNLAFDGNNSWIDLSSNTSNFSLTEGQPFELEVTFKTTNFHVSRQMAIFSYIINQPLYEYWKISIFTDKNDNDVVAIELYTNGVAQDLSGTTIVSDGEYHIVKVIFDGSTLELFVDGISEGSMSAVLYAMTDFPYMAIGSKLAENGLTQKFNGIIKNVKFSKSNVLISEWKLNEGKGLIAKDCVGSNDGVIYNSAWVKQAPLWESFKIITVDSTKIDDDLINYPIMVKLTPENFDFSRVRSDGMDIAFYDMSNNLLDFEREYFVYGSIAIYHVRIPNISSIEDTQFKVIFGKGLATDLSNKTGVWDSNFIMVHHMGDDLKDSTSNNNDGVASGTISEVGLNGKSRYFDGIDDTIVTPYSAINANYTFFALEKSRTFTEDYRTHIISKRGTSGGISLTITGALQSPSGSVLLDTHGSGIVTSSTPTVLNVYSTIAGTLSPTGSKVFVDGVSDGTVSSVAWTDIVEPIRFGSRGTSMYWYNGWLDEIRVSNIVRSDAWIKADDYNLRLNTLVSIA